MYVSEKRGYFALEVIRLLRQSIILEVKYLSIMSVGCVTMNAL